MILPDNGKVVIIDDDPEDVKHLANALTREKMPFLFFKDLDMGDMPSTPVRNVRLMFLDFDLGLGGSDPVEKIRLVQARIERIVEKRTPYILIVWSRHEDQCLPTLQHEFENGFRDFAPVKICSLDKAAIKKIESEDGNDVITHIRTELKSQLKKFESINAFFLWESIVSKSCGEIVNGFVKVFDLNENWDVNIKGFLFRLAKANVGEDRIKNLTNEKKLQFALETINSALIDSIEKNIKINSHEVQLSIEDSKTISSNELVQINTKLHILKSPNIDHFEQGNIYFQSFNDENLIKDVVKHSFNSKVDDIVQSNPQIIKLDITPACDYAQDKGYTRLLTGLLVDSSFFKQKKSKGFIYDQCPIMEITGEVYMLFDFRYIKSFRKEIIAEYYEKPNFKIRSQLLTDIQAQASNHMNRPGIISVH